uniref:G-protein coupled receptors family 1 profile domain-containing protein n=1 Tax=Knipowitschia caucasica TaxID=637954 RepID=A0AAV2LJB9_KNICA
MSVRRALSLWGAAVLYPLIIVTYSVSLTTQLALWGYKLHRIFCANRPIVNHACGETLHTTVPPTGTVFTTVSVPLFTVLYSYVRILVVCKRSNSEVRRKAVQTCVPHLVTFVVYCCSVFVEMAISQFNRGQINPVVAAIISLEYLMVPSINNPLIYGLKLPQFVLQL